ncbi:MAG TPA: hypothetical protein VKY65_07575 [Alphaproteobacteria bacterium]|nr:hypothetical protein [Alphaproteobacteria bacterium]
MYLRILLMTASVAIAFPLAAQAATQMLGVISSAAPIPMTCDGTTCTAELSAFCLQRDRSSPPDGTAYRAVDPSPLTLLAVAADGSTRAAPLGAELHIASARSYSAVTVSVPEALRDSLKAARLEISVGPHLTLAPVATADDPQPLTDKEIATAAGTLDAIASDLFATDEHAQIVTAQVMNRLINALPSAENSETLDLAKGNGLWGEVIGGTPKMNDPRPGMAEAAIAYESCRRGATYVQGLTLRRCLEASHDALMGSINQVYWRAVAAGS